MAVRRLTGYSCKIFPASGSRGNRQTDIRPALERGSLESGTTVKGVKRKANRAGQRSAAVFHRTGALFVSTGFLLSRVYSVKFYIGFLGRHGKRGHRARPPPSVFMKLAAG